MNNYSFYNNSGGTIESAPFTDVVYSSPDENPRTVPLAVVKGHDSPSVFSAAGHFNNFWADIATDIQYLEQSHTLDQTTIDHINNVINNSHFLWGNIYDGGLSITKVYTTGNNRASFVWWMGMFEHSDGVHVKFPARWGGIANWTDIPISKLSECCVATDINQTGTIAIIYGYNTDGTCDRQVGSPIWQDPLTQLVIIGWNYASDGNKTVYECICKDYTQVYTPQFPQVLNYTYCPDYGFGNVGIATPVMPIEASGDWSTEGSWYGGDNNLSNDINDDGGISQPDGGGGAFDNDSDPVHNPDMNTLLGVDAINSGFITIYNPTQQQVQDFNDFLFAGITEDMSAVLKRLISSPLDYVVSLSMIHYQPSVGSVNEDIKFCGLNSGVSAKRVLHQYAEIDCGSMKISEHFASALDYGGYTKAKLAVPYCGIYPISIDDIMGGTVHGYYRIDLLTGNCIFTLETKRDSRSAGDAKNLDSILYQFTGNCINSLPISATDWRGLFQGACQVASGIGALASGNYISGASSIAGGVLSMKPDVVKSGNLATTYSYMSVQKPYFIFERPVQNLPSRYSEYRGYPSNIYRSLRDCEGLTIVSDTTLWSMNINGTDKEMEEIKELFYEGVYI